MLHSLDDALRHSDRALLLADGKVVHAGTTSDVIRAEPIREVYQVEMLPGAGLGFRLRGAHP